MGEQADADLQTRYREDARFRAVVHEINAARGGGFTDEHGVRHPGPTQGDAELAARVIRVFNETSNA